MIWKRKLSRVASVSSLKSDEHRVLNETKHISYFVRLEGLSIINFIVVSSVLLLSMVKGQFTPQSGPNNISNWISMSANGTSYHSNYTHLVEVCRTKNLTTVNITEDSNLLKSRIDSCNFLTWKDITPPEELLYVTEFLRGINCSFLLGINDKLEALETQFRSFQSVIDRYDCNSEYSVKTDCKNCLVSYRNWLCLMNFRMFHNENIIKPCLGECYQVMRDCPLFAADDGSSYGGYSIFSCPQVKDVENSIAISYSLRNCKKTNRKN